MQSKRSTKKYCSDNCKQHAFYKRNWIQLSETTEKEPLNDKSILINENNVADLSLTDHPSPSFTIKQQQKEPAYQWIRSDIVDTIADYTENHMELSMFQYPQQHWGANVLPTVKWVSLRLRCLLEILIKISNLSEVSSNDLFRINKAFNTLVASPNFNKLPTNYPYTALIKELDVKLTSIAKRHKGKKSIRFRLTLNRKAELIAKRYLIADFVPPAKFSEMNFAE